MQADKAAIDDATAEFFNAFTNRNGVAAHVDRLYALFAPGAVIIKNIGGDPVVYDVPGFVEPRRALLSDGTLTDFQEEEVSERTEIFGNIAHRFSSYGKSWKAEGRDFEGGGAKSIQFIRTADGWKISALAWDDR